MIFLIGFMGSGKTYWGRKWSAAAGFEFIDLDELIEQREKMPVEKLFEKKGESYFRMVEHELLTSIQPKEHLIVSCGGGTPCYDNNMRWMNEKGCTVYLHANPTRLLDNLSSEIQKRPLFKKVNKGEVLFFIDKKLKERSTFYDQAQIRLEVAELNDDIIFQIIKSAKNA